MIWWPPMAEIPIGDADYSFIAAAARQLHPVQRPVFAERVHALLQDIAEPGPGDVDRAVRKALQGIWEPAPEPTTGCSRWSRAPKARRAG
jgi:hypothetical protein